MADVSNNLQHEDEFYHHPNPFSFDDYTTPFDFDLTLDDDNNSNPNCDYEDPNCFFYGAEDDDDDEQMNFVTDLFDNSRHPHESTQEFGFGPGLLVADMDSESDSEGFEVNSGITSNVINDDGDGDGDDVFGSFRVSNNGYHVSEDFEWEEVNEMLNIDERENLNTVIDRIEEITVSSDISSSEGGENSRLDDDDEGEERARNLEWEVLLAVNNLDRNFEFDEINGGGDGVARFNLPEDSILTMEYDALFGQLVENENALKGSPPAAKHVVEGLATVVVTKEDVGEISSVVVCAVCKDEVSVGEEVKKMPCCHLYHGECIVPWLKIRNTCPVCRYELPTDDRDYEKRRSGRVGNGNAGRLADDFEVRYNFELLP